MVIPKLKSGLLPSITRKILLQSEEVKEKTLTIEDLKNAKKVYLGNSVRGWAEVKNLEIS